MSKQTWVAILIYQGEAILALNGDYVTSANEDSYGEMVVLEAAANSLALIHKAKLQTINTDGLIDEVEDGECSAVIRATVEHGLIKFHTVL